MSSKASTSAKDFAVQVESHFERLAVQSETVNVTNRDVELFSTSTLQDTVTPDLSKEVAALRGDIRKRAAETATALKGVLDRVAGIQKEFLFNIEQLRSEHATASLDNRIKQLELHLDNKIDVAMKEERTAREIDMSTLKLVCADASKQKTQSKNTQISNTEMNMITTEVSSVIQKVSDVSLDLKDRLSKERMAREADIAQVYLLLESTRKSFPDVVESKFKLFPEMVESKFCQLMEALSEERVVRASEVTQVKQLIDCASEKVLPEIKQNLTQVKQLSLADKSQQNNTLQMCKLELQGFKDVVSSLALEVEGAKKARDSIDIRFNSIQNSLQDMHTKLITNETQSTSLQQSLDLCLKDLEMKFLQERKKACETQNNQFELCLKELEMKVSEERSMREASALKVQDIISNESRRWEETSNWCKEVIEREVKSRDASTRHVEHTLLSLVDDVAKETSEREDQINSVEQKIARVEKSCVECKTMCTNLEQNLKRLWKAMDTHVHDFSTRLQEETDTILASQASCTAASTGSPRTVPRENLSPRMAPTDTATPGKLVKVTSTGSQQLSQPPASPFSSQRLAAASPVRTVVSPTLATRSMIPIPPRYPIGMQSPCVSFGYPAAPVNRMLSSQISVQRLESASNPMVSASMSKLSPRQQPETLSPRETLGRQHAASQQSFIVVNETVMETTTKSTSGVASYAKA